MGASNPTDFSPDGKALVVHQAIRSDVGLINIEKAPTSVVKPLVAGPTNEVNGTLSPDGRWLAYESAESGRNEIYVRPFPAVESGRWQVSTAGGTRPHWGRDGRELFFITSAVPRTVMTVPVTPGARFVPGSPARLFEAAPYLTLGYRLSYDVSADGKRFLMIKAVESEKNVAPPQINVVLNWVDELKRLAPAN